MEPERMKIIMEVAVGKRDPLEIVELIESLARYQQLKINSVEIYFADAFTNKRGEEMDGSVPGAGLHSLSDGVERDDSARHPPHRGQKAKRNSPTNDSPV
jgi:hypothetical protein